MLIINFKTYKQGNQLIKLVKTIKQVNKNIIIATQPTDIYKIKKATNLKIYSQHTDPYKLGRHTGFILPEAIKEAGAVGTLLNHSEHKLTFSILKQTIQRCKKLKLKTIVFA
ncbi:MAG: triose-phosphate isomerase, partial [Nanoarchaeota archaeon]